MCIPKRRERNSLYYCIASNQILVSDEDQQVHIVGCGGAKSAVYCFLVGL